MTVSIGWVSGRPDVCAIEMILKVERFQKRDAQQYWSGMTIRRKSSRSRHQNPEPSWIHDRRQSLTAPLAGRLAGSDWGTGFTQLTGVQRCRAGVVEELMRLRLRCLRQGRRFATAGLGGPLRTAAPILVEKPGCAFPVRRILTTRIAAGRATNGVLRRAATPCQSAGHCSVRASRPARPGVNAIGAADHEAAPDALSAALDDHDAASGRSTSMPIPTVNPIGAT
jgi:hypothetical protein